MLAKQKLKEIQALKLAKYRKKMKLFIAEGAKVVIELLDSRFEVHSVYCQKEHKYLLDNRLNSEQLYIISHKDLERISLLKNPGDVFGIFHMDPTLTGSPVSPDNLLIVLDGISNPGNFGTILRTADWFGINEVVCSQDCVDIYNPKVVQSSMGSIARVRVHYTALNEYLEKVSKYIEIFGAVLQGENLYHTKLPDKAILVIGNESRGISGELLPYIQHRISIPPFNTGIGPQAESLNASIATAIICSEFRRQTQ